MGNLSTVSFLYLGLVISYFAAFKGMFFAMKISNSFICESNS